MQVAVLRLKKNCIVMLLRNIDVVNGLCNGTRLVVKEMKNNYIIATPLNGHNKDVVISRSSLTPSDTKLPFILKRRQLPITLAFAITINKSQGQSFETVGVYLGDKVFSHGQLYVALSRTKNKDKLFIQLEEMNSDRNRRNKMDECDKKVTTNVVLKEVFRLANL